MTAADGESGRVIQVSGLSKAYPGGPPVLSDVSLEVGAGDKVALEGRSGAGKTTLLNIIAGLDLHYEGKVLVDGRDLSTMDDKALSSFRSRTVGFVFQSFHLLADMSVEENVMLPAHFSDRFRRNAKERARELLERVGIKPPWTRKAHTLSGGQKQRIAIARAVFNKPRLLLCDEPTGHLDADTGEAVLDLLVDISDKEGAALLMVTHEPRVSRRAQRVLSLEGGRLTEPAGGGR